MRVITVYFSLGPIANLHLDGCGALPVRLHLLLLARRGQAGVKAVREAAEYAGAVLALPASRPATEHGGGYGRDQADRRVGVQRAAAPRCKGGRRSQCVMTGSIILGLC